MHELVDLGHSMTRVVVGLCQDETRTSEHIGISAAEEAGLLLTILRCILSLHLPVMYFNSGGLLITVINAGFSR
jgi:hypothetical protein